MKDQPKHDHPRVLGGPDCDCTQTTEERPKERPRAKLPADFASHRRTPGTGHTHADCQCKKTKPSGS